MRIFAVLLDLYPVIYYVFEERLCEFLRTLNNYRIAERIVIENPYIINIQRTYRLVEYPLCIKAESFAEDIVSIVCRY